MRTELELRKGPEPRPPENGEDHGGDTDSSTDDTAGGGGPRIRCPKCRWQPKREDRWQCVCGHVWNTFATAGRCPGCHMQWTDTACPACGEWSAHVDWYESGRDAEH